MKTTLLALAAALASLLPMGCSSVSSPFVVGEPIKEDLSSKVNGIWKVGDAVYYAKQVRNGELRVATTEWTSDTFRLVATTVLLTEYQGGMYINYLSPEPPKDKPEYFFARCGFADDGSLVAYGPVAEVFAQGVGKKELQGEINRSEHTVNVKITGGKESFLKFIQNDKVAEQFTLSQPLIVHRIVEQK